MDSVKMEFSRLVSSDIVKKKRSITAEDVSVPGVYVVFTTPPFIDKWLMDLEELHGSTHRVIYCKYMTDLLSMKETIENSESVIILFRTTMIETNYPISVRVVSRLNPNEWFVVDTE